MIRGLIKHILHEHPNFKNGSKILYYDYPTRSRGKETRPRWGLCHGNCLRNSATYGPHNAPFDWF